jgi:hypothetical protein
VAETLHPKVNRPKSLSNKWDRLRISHVAKQNKLKFPTQQEFDEGKVCIPKYTVTKLQVEIQLHAFLTLEEVVVIFIVRYKYYVYGHYPSSCLYLKQSCLCFKHNVSETGFCLRLQVKPIQLGPIDRASPHLRTINTTFRRLDSVSVFRLNLLSWVQSIELVPISGILTQCFGDWILSPSSGKSYSVGSNR